MSTHIEMYRSQRCTWEEFVAAVWPTLVRQIEITSNGNHQQAVEAAGEFYPHLRRLVHRYRDTGSSFDAYLRTSVRYFCRKKYAETGQRRLAEVVAEPEHPVFNGLFTHEKFSHEIESRPYPFHDDGTETLRSRDATRRQLLFVLCSNLPILDNDELERYSSLLDVPVGWLYALQTVALTIVERRRERKTRLAELRDRHYAFVLESRRQLLVATTEERRNRYERSHRYHYARWQVYRRRLHRNRCTLSHREVALLLGVPKGSIDSAIHSFRHKVEDTCLAV